MAANASNLLASSTRELILDAAEQLIGVLGYSKTTVEDIARAARVGKRTVYIYFPSKEEVVLCTIDRIVDRLTARLRSIAQSDRLRADAIRAMLIERVLFRFDSVRDYRHGLDELFASLRPVYLARRRTYYDAEAKVFAEVLAQGRGNGEFAAIDPEISAETLLLATNSLLPYALSARELGLREDVQARAERIADLLLHGLCRKVRPS
jgi:AcrR family transcriptional regulator